MSDVRTLRLLLCTALLAAAATLLTIVTPDAAAAKTPACAEQVVNDWYGNLRVDKIYPLPCYLAAIRSLPVDVRDYSRAEEDIRRALAYARQSKPDPGPSGGPTPSEDDDPPPSTGPPEDPGSTTGPGLEADPGTTPTGPPSDPGDPGAPGDPTNAEEPFDTSGPSSIPIPLFILGGLALLLLAAGAAGYLSRRAQARRPGGPPGT